MGAKKIDQKVARALCLIADRGVPLSPLECRGDGVEFVGSRGFGPTLLSQDEVRKLRSLGMLHPFNSDSSRSVECRVDCRDITGDGWAAIESYKSSETCSVWFPVWGDDGSYVEIAEAVMDQRERILREARDGGWSFTFTGAYGSGYGKQRCFIHKGYDTKEEAEEAAREFLKGRIAKARAEVERFESAMKTVGCA